MARGVGIDVNLKHDPLIVSDIVCDAVVIQFRKLNRGRMRAVTNSANAELCF